MACGRLRLLALAAGALSLPAQHEAFAENGSMNYPFLMSYSERRPWPGQGGRGAPLFSAHCRKCGHAAKHGICSIRYRPIEPRGNASRLHL
ncbi:MAG: hypothetical protein DU429_03080 [Candidatus Tokpelaia sp.]|nr:MAG: hypothetical protein DU430_05825 [Candidatus Tokpelaia sp.]KAA6207446.1 MAG: hypothetical protein DU429_03080 [Candidatus Tokpelaia sp.]